MRFLHRYGALWSLFLYLITRETHKTQITTGLLPARWRRESFEGLNDAMAKLAGIDSTNLIGTH